MYQLFNYQTLNRTKSMIHGWEIHQSMREYENNRIKYYYDKSNDREQSINYDIKLLHFLALFLCHCVCASHGFDVCVVQYYASPFMENGASWKSIGRKYPEQETCH